MAGPLVETASGSLAQSATGSFLGNLTEDAQLVGRPLTNRWRLASQALMADRCAGRGAAVFVR